MHSRTRHRPAYRAGTSRVLVGLLAFVLCLRSLAPDGYMFGSMADGWPVVLCPEGLPAGFLSQSRDAPRLAAETRRALGHGHQGHVGADPMPPEPDPGVRHAQGGHQDHEGAGADAMAQHCPWGSALDNPSLVLAASRMAVVAPPQRLAMPGARVRAPPRRVLGRHAPRAPPFT